MNEGSGSGRGWPPGRAKREITAVSPWFLWLAVAGGCTLLQAAGWIDGLRFDRELLNTGEVTRLFTSQLVHLNWYHWALNMGGMFLVAMLFGRYGTLLAWAWILFFSMTSVGLGLWTLNPELRWYVGLSGALHGLMMAGILLEMRVNRFAGGFLLLLIVAKLVWEQLGGAMPGSERLIEGRVVVDSHLYGAIGGALAAGIHLLVAGRKGLPSLRDGKGPR